MSSLEKVSGANVVLSAVALRVIELTVAPTLAESCTSSVMSIEKAKDPEPDSPVHCGLQRVAVIGLGRTERLKVPPLDPDRSEGAVVRLPQAIDAVRAIAVTLTRSVLLTVSPKAVYAGGATSA
jgi:hypothetical protein